MNSDWNSKFPHDMQTASGLRLELARVGRLRTASVKSPLSQISFMLSPHRGRPERQEQYDSGGKKVSRDSTSHGHGEAFPGPYLWLNCNVQENHFGPLCLAPESFEKNSSINEASCPREFN